MKAWYAVVAGGVILGNAACGGDSEPLVLTSVQVTPATVTFTIHGQTQQFVATPLDQNGDPIEGLTVQWSIDDSTTATVTAAGVVKAVASGTATVRATTQAISGTGSVTVQQVPNTLLRYGGEGQTGPAGQPLPTPIEVEARDGTGYLIRSLTITFSVTSGGGSVSPATVTTGENGRAAATWTLGGVGSQQARAAVSGTSLEAVTFSATAN